MKRKIAAIFAADIAGYSRLVAEDEEETLRRLASYRAVTDDFIARSGGRIFNTAGDAVLAEFPSAVEAVRCAIDIQESLRTRNMAYPPSRQMSFRIGITIGDVVERDGDLLGDGVNIAARLEGLAEVGGICISRAVHEQVANKLSVQFADIGAQEVKNIPTPVHAYMVAMRREDGTYATPLKKPLAKAAAAPSWMWPLAMTVVCLVAIGVGGFLYFTRLEVLGGAKGPASAANNVAPAPSAVANPILPAATPALAPLPSTPAGGKFAAEVVPFVPDRVRLSLASDYGSAADYKALAINANGSFSFSTGQQNEEIAKNVAVEQCQKRADAVQSPRSCEIYAVGNGVIYPHGHPPMPPLPWIVHDPLTQRPFVARDVPMVHESGRARLESVYASGRKTRAIAVGPGGAFFFNIGIESVEESMRRILETCGAVAGVACMIVAVDDTFVVPVPSTLKAIGFFRADRSPLIAGDARDDVSRKLADASSGWNAIAVGTAGRPGLGLKAASEQSAIDTALAECAKRDRDCHVIAIGPFTVAPG